MEDFIYLEIDEEITSVIDRLQESKAKKVGIVIPRGAMILQSVVNLKLIQRSAAKAKKHVAIITVDKVGRSLATQVGLPVFDDPKQAETSSEESAKAAPAKTSDVIEIDMSENPEGDELPEGVKVNYYTGEEMEGKAEGRQVQQKDPATEHDDKPKFAAHPVKSSKPVAAGKPANKRKRKVKIIIGIVAVVLALIASWVFLTKATVTVAVPAEALEAKADVTVDATLMASQPEDAKVKGTFVSTEKEITKDIKATGIKKVGDKASGTVTFYNDAGVDQALAAGTTLTGNGKNFTLSSAITVPKATLDAYGSKVQGSADGKIVAAQAGTEYNMSSSTTYSVSGNNYVTAKGETSGGTSEEKTIVSEEDLAGAEDALVADAPQELKDELSKQAEGQYIVESAIGYEVTNFSADKSAGEEATTFKVTAKVVAQAIAFKESDMRDVVAEAVKGELPEGQALLTSEDDIMTPELTSSDLPKKEMQLAVTLKTHVGNEVDTNGLATKIKGKAVKNARETVASNLAVSIDDVQVSVKPNTGLVRLPFFSKNIKFKLDYKAASENSSN